MKKLRLNLSSKMLGGEDIQHRPSESSIMLSHYISLNRAGASIDSTRVISHAAEDKINSNPSLSILANHDRIVSVNSHERALVSPIEDTRYHERNYLARKVVKPAEI